MQPEWMPATAANFKKAFEKGEVLMVVADGDRIHSGCVVQITENSVVFSESASTSFLVGFNARTRFVSMEPPSGFRFRGLAPAKLPLD